MKKCKCCKKEFSPRNSLQKVCSIECAILIAKDASEYELKRAQKAIERIKREDRAKAREKIKTRSEWIREAQTAFNAFIRERDHKEPCISCGRHHSGQYHAGHYRSVGACPELRFEEINVHKQCSVCNNHLSGNALDYRINLIKKITLEKVEWLESKHEPKRYTIDELKEIKRLYKEKTKELRKLIA